MNTTCRIISAGLLLALGATAEEAYRIFTDTQGRTIEAVIVRYNELDNTVTLHPKGRSAQTVPVSIFSDKDQAYIISSSHKQAFLDERIFSVDISAIDKFDRFNIRRDDYGEEKGFYHFFAITFENKSTVDLDDISLEYVMFYQQEHNPNGEGWKKENREGTLYRKTRITIPHKSKKELATEAIRLREYRAEPSGSSGNNAWADLDSEMDGIMLRISMRTRDGETLSRQITYPKNLDKVWTTKTRKVP